ncbi:ADP-ribosylglycohydrolase family protein [Luteimicrobium subarcticum]|uniref:ADP-ribosylglycohydrolase n=1 Tax=Luteimicrobium subarcticum TaxID=620910 RepID=A0A2M8WW39_9MICO|nr:ADP-ribosylglycohydrolase family protein [Luteimicrobium subarcticum]PJI95136.1 ADP-ribosylglycohydrolase [Luteimicrobium subarcticum]
MNPATTDRAAGVLLGQACGDALGVPYEFGTPPAPSVEAEMRGGGLGPYAPGEWSDDTQMALCIARVAATGADLRTPDALDEVAAAFEGWLRGGASDVGIQTSAVLRAAARLDGTPSQRLATASAAHHARTGRTAGNGALMRTSVVGLTALDDRVATVEAARAVAELTHADPLAGDSCVLWSEAVRVAVTARRLDVRAGLDLLPAERRERWAAWIDDAERPDTAPDLRGNGFTVTALQAAWHAIATTPVPQDDPASGSFACRHLQDALHAAVRIGGDTDTVAAIAGGLLGAYWGASAVPAAWRRVVHGWPGMRARDLVGLGILTARGGVPDSVGWPAGERVDYPWVPVRRGVPHPADEGVVLGTVATVDHGCDAVVTLCRRGTAQVPAAGVRPEDHVEVWLMDSERPGDNPNLDFVLHDTADVVAALRAEGRRVMLHCVAAEQRTPVVAIAYAARLGVPRGDAARAVRAALPSTRGRGLLWDHVTRSAAGADAQG